MRDRIGRDERTIDVRRTDVIDGRMIDNYTITLKIQALSSVESHDLLEDRRTELRHT